MKLRRFQISGKLFWGFRTLVNVETATTEALILTEIQNSLYSFLSEANLLALLDEAKKMKLHLHDDVASIVSHEETTFFACDHACLGVTGQSQKDGRTSVLPHQTALM